MSKQLQFFVVALLFVCATNPLFSQAGGYSFTASTGTYTPVSSGATVVSALHADGGEADVPIGFNFEFEDVSYNTVAATSDGFLSFVPGATSNLGNNLDNGAASRRPLVAPLWDDLDGQAATSQAAYEVTGTAPNRVFTFEWRNWEWDWSSGDSVISFQAKLYETSNEIAFTYRWECSSCINSPDASIGLSGVSTWLSVTGVGTGSLSVTNISEDAAIDTVVTDQIFTFTPPTCLLPTALSLSNIGSGSVDFNWTTGGATAWQISYDTTGNIAGANIVNVTSAPPYSLTGLPTGVPIDIYVRDSCGVGDVSFWAGPITVSLPCAAQNAPYSTNFDSYITGFDPFCWSSYASGGSAEVSTAGSPRSGSQQLELDGTSTTSDTLLSVTPQFGDINAGNKQIRFFTKGTSTIDTLFIGTLSSLSTSSVFDYIDTVVFTGSSFSEIIIPFSTANGYNGSDQYIAFMHSMYGGSSIYIDDFTYELIPPCSKITSPVVLSLASDSVVIGFDNGGSTVDVEWGPAGFTQGTGCFASAVSSPNGSFTINNSLVAGCANPIMPNTCYDIYVRTNCAGSGNGFSIWEGPIRVCTPCATQSLPFVENFTNSLGCFTVLDSGTTTDTWVWAPAGGTSNTGDDIDGTGYGLVDSDEAGSVDLDEYMVSPKIDAGSITGQLIIEFDQFYRMFGSTQTGDLDVWDGTQWVNVLSQQSTVGSFANPDHQFIDVTAYANADFQVRFHFYDANFDWWWAVDNFSVREVNCFASTGLSPYAIGSDSIAINWTPGDGNSFGIEYGPTGFAPGSGTMASTVDTFFTASSLTPNTAYDFYLTDTCASGFSTPLGPITITTACTPVTAPYTENFDGPGWTSGTGASNLGDTIGSCWTRNTVPGAYSWGVRSTPPTSGGGGPSADNSGAGNFIFTEASNGSTGNVAIFTSPLVDVSGLTIPYLTFYYHRAGDAGEMPDLSIEVNDGSGWVTALSMTGPDQAASADPFKEKGVDLSSFGNIIQVRFVSVSKGCCQGDQAIDDVAIGEAPSCPNLIGLNVSGISDTTATFNWTSGPTATSYQVWFGPRGFYQGTQTTTGTKVITATNSFTTDTLSANTCYEFLVRAICSPGDSSMWEGPVEFTTNSGEIALPVAEDFENGFVNFINVCGNISDWQTQQSIIHGGTEAAKLTYVADENSVLEMAGYIDLSGTTNPVLSFWHIAKFEGGFDEGIVEISTDAGQTYTPIPATAYQGSAASYSSDLFFDEDSYTIWGTTAVPAQNSWWQKETFDLAAYKTDSVRIRFRTTSDGSIQRDGWYIDDILINEPTCSDPSSLGVVSSSLTATAVDIYWTGGGAANFNIEYGLAGFTKGAGTLVNATNDTLNLTGLAPATCYEFYVRDSCGQGDVSSWIGPFTFGSGVSTLSLPVSEGFENGFVLFKPGCTGTTGWNTEQTIIHGGSTSAKLTYVASDQSILELAGYVDLTNTVNPVLSFWHIAKLEGGWDEGLVEISTDGGATYAELPASTYSGNSATYASDLLFDEDSYTIWGTTAAPAQNTWWQKETFDLSGFKQDSVRIRFRIDADGSVQRDGWYIDDILINEPTCADPSNLGVVTGSVTATSVDIYWTGGGASDFNIEYGPSGFTPGMGTALNATNDTLSLTGLAPSGCYAYYVRDSCGPGDVSSWIGPFAFSTNATSISYPVSEDFENGFVNFKNSCSNISQWAQEQTIVNGGLNSAKLNYLSNDNSSMELAGYVDLTNTANPGLTFWHIAKLEGGFDDGMIEISTDAGETYSPLPASAYLGTSASYPGSLLFDEDAYVLWGTTDVPALNTWWQKETFDLSAYKTDSVRIRFRLVSDGSIERDGWYIDDILIDELSLCPAPVGLTANVIGCDSVSISWTSDPNATSSYLEYGPTGFAPGAGTSVPNVTSPYNLTGLNLDTDYDVYVSDSCTAAGSTVAGPVSFTTDSVGPVMASFLFQYVDTTFSDARVSFDAGASTGDGLSFSWDFDGSSGGGIRDTAVYTANGSYDVTLTVTDRCGNTDDTTITIVVGGISVSENTYSNEVAVYPNPNNGDFVVSVSAALSEYTLEVMDVSGRIVYRMEEVASGMEVPVELKNAAPGVYLIRLRGEGFSSTERVIVR